MTELERAACISALLDRYIPSPSITLKYHSPYTLLIATLLSAQCTDARVNRVTPWLFHKAAQPAQMVRYTIPEIAQWIRPCGCFNKKAAAIWHLSEELIRLHSGRVPCDWQALEALPGVGHKTASVVMGQAFGQPAFPVDTHIHRCAIRWQLSPSPHVTDTERALKALFPQSRWHRVHLQIITFARTFCPARGHLAGHCPICSTFTCKLTTQATLNVN